MDTTKFYVLDNTVRYRDWKWEQERDQEQWVTIYYAELFALHWGGEQVPFPFPYSVNVPLQVKLQKIPWLWKTCIVSSEEHPTPGKWVSSLTNYHIIMAYWLIVRVVETHKIPWNFLLISNKIISDLRSNACGATMILHTNFPSVCAFIKMTFSPNVGRRLYFSWIQNFSRHVNFVSQNMMIYYPHVELVSGQYTVILRDNWSQWFSDKSIDCLQLLMH